MSSAAFKQMVVGKSAEDLVSMARFTECAERYEDMCVVMKALVETKKSLAVDERNLFSVAYKNVVGALRGSLRALEAGDGVAAQLNDLYRRQMQSELVAVCTEVQGLLATYLINDAQNEEQVFYLKMGADYFRYLAECLPDATDTPSYPDQASDYYKRAFAIASSELPATHPIRLGLALNYSVCLYEIKMQKKEACALAKDAFDQAISQLDKLAEADYKDATLIMQLLRDNLTLWTSSDEDNDDDEN